MDVYVERSDFEICRDDVFENSDIAELTEWLEEQRNTGTELAIMLGAMKLAPNYETGAMARKLGFVNISISWIQKRLQELGVENEDVFAPKEKRMRAHIKTMEEAIQTYKGKVKALNAEVQALRQRVKDLERENV